MTNKKAASVLLAAVVAGSLVVLSAVAWACTGAQAQVSIVPRSAAVGEPVKVVSQGFSPLSPVEIRWNSATGPVVGSAGDLDKAVAVNIPADAKPGLYYLVVMDVRTQDKISADSFQVLAGSSRNPGSATPAGKADPKSAGDLWSAFDSKNPGAAVDGSSSTPASGRAVAVGWSLVALAGLSLLTALGLATVSASKKSRRKIPSNNLKN